MADDKLPEEDKAKTRPDDIPEVRAAEAAGGQGDKAGSGSSSGSGQHGDRPPSDTPPEASASGGGKEDPEQGLFNEDDWRNLFTAGFKQDGKRRFRLSKRDKIIAGIIATVISGTVAMASVFFMGIFNLPNYMKNVEAAGFQRYQIDLEGRSVEWLQAYMTLRFGEIDDPNLQPKDRDNLLFRADNVRDNNGLKNWYRTLRASKFEQNLFESKGIKFTSVAYKDGNIIKFRAGVIRFPDTQVRFDPRTLGYDELDALSTGDINNLNGRLRGTFEETTFKNDKEARAFIKKTVKENKPGWWKAVKRYHLRQDIQNMIGVRKWKFFENKRNENREKTISMRNKIITQSLPDDSKTGAFIKCLFGVPDCKASTDPANPDNNSDPVPSGTNKQGDKTDGNKDSPKPLGDGSGESTLADAASVDAAGTAGGVAGKIISKLIAKAGVLSLLDSLSRFDEAIHSNTFSKIVSQVKGKRYVGYLATFMVATDQLTTGQQLSGEVNDFMLQFKHPTQTEGWKTVIDPENSSNKVSAASTDYVKAKNKAQFCSEKHQAEMKKYPKQAEKEFQWNCPQNTVGGVNNAQELEDSWNNGPGKALHPVLKTYHAATGGIFDVFNSVASAVTDPAVNAALSATGTKDDVEHLAAYAGEKALDYGGATNNVNEDTPSGQLSNDIIQGSAVMAEATTRNQGGIPSTAESVMETQKNLVAYQKEQEQTGFFNRYLSPSNPKSLFSTEFFALTTSGLGDLGKSIIGVFGSALSSPWRVISQPAHAAVPDGYKNCRDFAKIQCMDIPPQCKNQQALSMSPQSATNGDELGYFKPGELTWDLMNNQDDWRKALYDKVGGSEEKALQVYNCALFDNTTRGGMGARYGAPGENAFKSQNGGGAEGDDTAASGTVSGDAQQLAQQILDNKDIELVTYCRYCIEDLENTAKGKHAYGNVDISINILKFLADLGSQTPINVNSITGAGSGHSSGSNHYIGKAVDFECGLNEKIADEVGAKYGLKANNERCDHGVNHSHYSPTGF